MIFGIACIQRQCGRIACHFLSFFLLAMIVAGCRDNTETLRQLETDQVTLVARQQLDMVRTGQISRIEAEIPVWKRASVSYENLQYIVSLFPGSEPEKVELTSYSRELRSGTKSGGTSHRVGDFDYAIGFQYSYPDKWIRAEISFHVGSGGVVLDDLSAHQLRYRLEEDPVAGLRHISSFGMAIIVLAALNLAFTLGTFFMTWRRPLLKWRWVWRVVIFAGVGEWFVDCQEDIWNSSLHVDLPVAWAYLASYSPLIITLHIPVFAIAFWLKFAAQQRQVRRDIRNAANTFS